MTENSIRIVEIIKNIPPGKVLTYGEIAKRSGNPRGARTVSRLLHSVTEQYQLPWHRVVNSKGKISLTGSGYDLQKKML